MKSIGLKILRFILKNDPSLITKYLKTLLSSFTACGYRTKLIILSLIKEYLSKSRVQPTIDHLISTMKKSAKNAKLREKIAEVVMFCTRQNHYALVEDFE